MKLKKHHNAKYIFSKIRMKVFELRNPQLPWLTNQSIEILDQLILRTDLGLEFGSGRSTRWLAPRCRKLFSIESNEFWYQKVSSNLAGFDNVEYYLRGIDESQLHASDYLTIFERIEDNSLDFILNDGKIRDLVAVRSLSKLKAGGLFILDNAERYIPNSIKIPESRGPQRTNHKNWNEFIQQTAMWRRIWRHNGVTSTLILIKT